MDLATAVPLTRSYAVTGIIAGVVSVLAFTVVHDIFISNIWSFFIIMAVAGAICGAAVSWSYARLVATPTPRSWLAYNLAYVLMLIMLGLVSVWMFEPMMSMAALMALNGPPLDLIGQALPMTLVFTVVAAVVITLFYERSWRNFGMILATTTAIVLLLGLNISALGLVDVPAGSFYLVAEFLGLVVLLNLVYAAMFLLVERRGMLSEKAA